MGWSSPFVLISLVLSLASVSQVLGALECPEETANYVSPSDSGHLLITASADEARNTALCHAICINYIFEGLVFFNGSNETAPMEVCAIVHAVHLRSLYIYDLANCNAHMCLFLQGVIQLNCKQFKQVSFGIARRVRVARLLGTMAMCFLYVCIYGRIYMQCAYFVTIND